MTGATTCPNCGNDCVDVSRAGEYTTYIHHIDRSGAIPSVDEYCIVDDPSDVSESLGGMR